MPSGVRSSGGLSIRSLMDNLSLCGGGVIAKYDSLVGDVLKIAVDVMLGDLLYDDVLDLL